MAWTPHRGPQERFHASEAFELLYGGAAGGGKSDSLLMEALRYVHVPGYAAIILRRTFPMLAQAGGLIPRSRELLTGVGDWNEERKTWRFRSGATLQFGHMAHESDRYSYQGASFAFIGFDELTQFTEEQYRYLFSRARTTATMPDGRAVPVRVRATSNPGGAGHQWVRDRWGAWLGDEATAKSGDVLYFKPLHDVETQTTASDPDGLSRQFIAASVRDNPTLLTNDPAYIQRLESLPLIERERLLGGNWAISPQGNVFRREWLSRIVERAPDGLHWVRYWDLAASVRTSADYTASVAMAMGADGTVYLRDMIRGRWEWPDQKKILMSTMLAEPAVEHGIEKALHGIAAVQDLLRERELARVAFRGIDVDRDKYARALPLSRRAEEGKVALVSGPWIPAFISELCVFTGSDDAGHDDQVDAASGCLSMLAEPTAVQYIPSIWR